jgi:hypothetical protein
METIKDVLMRRDGIPADEADAMIASAQDDLRSLVENDGSYEEAVDIIAEHFGLEPDYMDELLYNLF